jgi:hypothetical protein
MSCPFPYILQQGCDARVLSPARKGMEQDLHKFTLKGWKHLVALVFTTPPQGNKTMPILHHA